MASMLNRCLRVTALVARLSGAVAIAWALASGVRLFAASDPAAHVSSEESTQLADAGSDGTDALEMLAGSPGLEKDTRAIAFAPCPENATVDCGTLTVPVDYRSRSATPWMSRLSGRGPPIQPSASVSSSATLVVPGDRASTSYWESCTCRSPHGCANISMSSASIRAASAAAARCAARSRDRRSRGMLTIRR